MSAQRGARATTVVQEAPRRSARALRIALGVVAAALAIAVYWNGLDNPFVYDDRDTVVSNPSLVDLSNVRFVFLYSLFRPAVNVSYALDRAVWGLAPFGFHLTNVLVHAAVVALFYVLCLDALGPGVRPVSDRGQTGVRPVSDRGQTGVRPVSDPTRVAFLTAAVFAVHPLMTEAVGYISGRSELLCALGFLAALICARTAIRTGSRAATTGAVLAAILAFASKETAIALPFVLMADDRWVVRADGWRRRLTRVYAPALAVLAAAGAVRLATLWAAAPAIHRSPMDNLLTQAIVVWRYVGLLVLPTGQTIMHDVRFINGLDAAAVLALVAIAGAAWWAIRQRASFPLVALGVTWFLLVLAPSSSIVPLREGMAEHRVYLASAGLFLALASLLARPLTTLVPARAAAGVVVAVCAILTLQRNVVWADPVALWAEAAAQAPDMWEPHFAYADVLREAGRCDAAIDEYQSVLRLRPDHRDAVTNLGICLAQAGRTSEAEAAFRRSLEVDPRWARGYTNLGALALTQQDYETARRHYLDALRVDPQNVLARMQLAQLYESVFHDYHAAARMCGEARAIAPATPAVVECVERNQRLAAERDAGR